MQRLLVTGASGFLGWNICQRKRNQWQICGTTFTHQVTIPSVDTVTIDLCDAAAGERLIEDISPDAVIHTAAEANANICQEHPARTRPINVDAAVNLAQVCHRRGIPFVHTSTDLVFDGLYPPYSEDSAVCPIGHYGQQKAAAEEGILECNPEASVCRVPMFFGLPSPSSSDFTHRMLTLVRENRPVRLFTDEYRTPVSVDVAIEGLFLALEQGVAGLLHLGGEERVSRYEFGQLLVEVAGLENAQLIPVMQRDLPMAAPRPGDVSLNSGKAFALGYHPGPLRHQLAAFLGVPV